MKLTRYTTANKKTDITASDAIFSQPVNLTLISQAVRVYRSNSRQGTSKVKTRAEVDLTKRKWFKQKGTGNARHGAQSAPIFVGGGVAHGPKGIENWSLDMTQKMKKRALISALSAQSDQFIIADGLTALEGKTKAAANLFNEVKTAELKNVTVLVDDTQTDVFKAVRNIENVTLCRWQDLNALDVASADAIVTTEEVLKKLEERLAK